MVSLTTRPVTQTAEVAVKRVSAKGVTLLSALQKGSIRMRLPIRMVRAKPIRMALELDIFFFVKGILIDTSTEKSTENSLMQHFSVSVWQRGN
jgi:hypothetical protein